MRTISIFIVAILLAASALAFTPPKFADVTGDGSLWFIPINKSIGEFQVGPSFVGPYGMRLAAGDVSVGIGLDQRDPLFPVGLEPLLRTSKGFGTLLYEDVEEDVDWLVAGRNKSLTWFLIVREQATLSEIRFRVENATPVWDDSLELQYDGGAITLAEPKVYWMNAGGRFNTSAQYVTHGASFSLRLDDKPRWSSMIIEITVEGADVRNIHKAPALSWQDVENSASWIVPACLLHTVRPA